MRELVIVIQDLYLHAEDPIAAGGPALPGLGFAARFGTRELLKEGWRAWLAAWAGRADLAATAPARIAAQAHPLLAGSAHTLWIAAPVHLSAGLSRVRLDPRGLLHLGSEEMARLAQDFAQAFAGSGFSLTPASPRELLLCTPGVPAVAALEPARFAGREVNDALPRGPAAAGLRRTWAEAEMWLHSLPGNQARGVPVTALWPWGAAGATAVTAGAARADAPAAFAADAYVHGLWHICGLACQAVPDGLGAVLERGANTDALLVVEMGSFLQDSAHDSGAALAQLDERYLVPAVRALRAGGVAQLRVIANDRCLSVTARAAHKFWRRARAALAVLA